MSIVDITVNGQTVPGFGYLQRRAFFEQWLFKIDLK